MNPLHSSHLHPAARSGETAPDPKRKRAEGGGVPRSGEEAGDDFSIQLAQAENINLRERIGRLEASIAFWAADLDETSEQLARVRRDLEDARHALRTSEDKRASLADQRASLLEDIAARDSHIAALEAQVTQHDLASIDARRTRARVQSIWRRLRARSVAQSTEISGLRRTVSLGAAARRQVEDALRQAQADAARNARYLDRIEARLARAERGQAAQD